MSEDGTKHSKNPLQLLGALIRWHAGSGAFIAGIAHIVRTALCAYLLRSDSYGWSQAIVIGSFAPAFFVGVS